MNNDYIRPISPLREKIIKKILGLTYRLDNTGFGDFTKNGETSFVRFVTGLYAEKDFTFFDIGANRGEYTGPLLESLGSAKLKAHIFEPQSSCFKELVDKFGDDKRIVINNFGLSDKDTSATLYKDFDKSGLASLHKRNLDHYGISMDMSENISLKKASDYVASKKINHINLIKIDIEGHEIAALDGFGSFLNAKNVDFIQFEYGGANLDSHTSLMELFAFFEKRGFVICKIMPKNLEIRKYDPRLENFMYQNYVAVNHELIS